MSEPFKTSIRVRCSVEHAFDAFTQQLDLWWPPGHRAEQSATMILEPRIGGRFFERNAAGQERLFGEVLRFEPPHRITYTWLPGAESSPTEVDVRFTTVGTETLVEVVHSEAASGLGDKWPRRVELFTRGWEQVLPALATFAQQHADQQP